MEQKLPAVLQVVGFKKTGKTTLVCALTERFAAAGLAVGTVKHDAHGFEPDVPETDSWRHRRSGAAVTAVASPARTAFFEERGVGLERLIRRMSQVDIVIVEGWKRERYPKIALVQTEEQQPDLTDLSGLIAVATWNDGLLANLRQKAGVPVFRYDETDALAEWLPMKLKLEKRR